MLGLTKCGLGKDPNESASLTELRFEIYYFRKHPEHKRLSWCFNSFPAADKTNSSFKTLPVQSQYRCPFLNEITPGEQKRMKVLMLFEVPILVGYVRTQQ